MINEKIAEIINFWFEETSGKQKYAKDESFDALIREKYEEVYWDIVKTKGNDWRKTPEGALAAIVVLDQFSRNMFRDNKQSFAEDGLALEIAEEMVKSGADKKVDISRRFAIYMPYMHSESKEVHEKALHIFKAHAKELGDDTVLGYEIKHKAIIDKFGRYPHRNAVLGRKSTPEEDEFNKEHGGF